MILSSNGDFEDLKNRYIAWWAHEDFGRAGISIKAPLSPKKGEAPGLPEKVEDRWLDEDYLRRRMDYVLSNTYYAGEAFPVWQAGYPGWDSIQVFLGCGIELGEDTGWWSPCMAEGEISDYDPAQLKMDRENPWYRKSREIRRLSMEECRGRAVLSAGAFGGCGDTLSAMRGNEALLIDIKDDPEAVLKLEMRLMDIWIEHFEEKYADLQKASDGSTCFLELWSPDKFYATQCDFAYMISPEDFERCFLPVIEKQANFLDRSIYHVDGIGVFKHVDALLAIDKIGAYQILPGAGKPGPLSYMDMLHKVQRAGKNLHITIPPEEVKTALALLSSKGLMIETFVKTKEEADDLLAFVKKNSVVRKV